MLIHNILLKNLHKEKHILYSYLDNKIFIKMLNNIYGHSNVSLLEESVFSHKNINLIICNDRLEKLETCIALCHYFHVPLLIVDHKSRPEHVHPNQIGTPKITHASIAIDDNIAESWGTKLHDHVINIDITKSQNLKQWENVINNISEQPYKIT